MKGADPEDGEPVYRPVSTLAVLALAAGLFSALALATPVLWVVPLLAAGLAVAAIRDTAADRPDRAGRGIALAGLALAVGFGCQAVGFAVANHWVERGRAVATVEAWQAAVAAGDWSRARDFCAPAALPASGDPFGGGPEPPHDHTGEADHDHGDDSPAIDSFRQLPAVAAVAACRRVRLAACRRDDRQAAGSWRVSLALADCDPAAADEVAVWVVPEIERMPRLTPGATGTERVARWRIIRFDLVE